MGNAIKIWLSIGAILVILGLSIFTVAMCLNKWDFTGLSTAKYVTNTYPISQDFTDISIKTDTADIAFVLSDTGACEVVCYEEENVRHRVGVENGCLTVRVIDERKWYEHIGIHIGTPKLTVTLPLTAYRSLVVDGSTGDTNMPGDFSFERIDISSSTGDVKCLASASESLKIRLSTGNIRTEDLAAGSLDFSVSTGHVTASNITCTGPLSIRVSTGKTTLSNVSCGSLTSTGSTGNVALNHVTVAGALSIERSTGHVKFEKCDAGELFIKTDTGDVTGSLLSDKVFIAQTSTGHVEVPKTVTGGRCEITSSTGDIKLKIEG